MFVSNVGYSSLKKHSGLHNWGFMSSKDNFDFNLDELDDFLDEMMNAQSPQDQEKAS